MAEIKVKMPGNFIPERTYVINILFREFLGLEIDLLIQDDPFYSIEFHGGRKIIIRDHFFAGFHEGDGYLKSSVIPSSVLTLKTPFNRGSDPIPVIYGNNEFILDNENIIIGADIFASAFFMLTRWEEHVSNAKDKHDRFPATESLAYKCNFLDSPVTNEYSELIWNLITSAGFTGRRSKREFRLIPTHDIDHFIFWNTARRKQLFSTLAGDIIKRHDIGLFSKRASGYFKNVITPYKDPYYTFSHLMHLAEEAGTKAAFYFFIDGSSKFDPEIYYPVPLFRSITSSINERGHHTGIHPSYNSFKDPDVLNGEIWKYREIMHVSNPDSRQHYLRFAVPETWRFLESCGVGTDSTMYYPGYPGFRCGSCYEFSAFDIIERKQLKLKERPLLIMDTCLISKSIEEAESAIKKIRQQVITFNGDFVFNWHNSNVLWGRGSGYRELFEHEFYAK